MKRYGRLMPQILEPNNLLLAFYKAQKGKAGKTEVKAFRAQLYEELASIREELAEGILNLGPYRAFTIYEPKKRKIMAASFRSRVIQHALINVCDPYFEKKFIDQSYACRKGKGSTAAVEQARFYNQKYQWFLKLDYRKFFDSIPHCQLKESLKNLFKDSRLLDLFAQIIDSYSVPEESGIKRGLPIGNLTSQYFSNYYLSSVDHYLKSSCRVPGYIRYMDDLVLWSNSKKELLDVYTRLNDYSQNQLLLSFKPICLNRNVHGLPFLSYVLRGDKQYLAQKSKRRFRKKIKKYATLFAQNIWTEEEYQRHLLPLLAFTERADAKRFRQKVLQEIGL